MVAPIHSQAFGSLGAVAAWFRTAKLIQHLMLRLFGLVLFTYVDDCFWVTPATELEGHLNSLTVACAFEFVVTHLLGWKLDPSKSSVGKRVPILGLDVQMGTHVSTWQLSSDKESAWVSELRE